MDNELINPLFHLTILPPKIPAAEALSQEISVLKNRFGGQLHYLNPNIQSPIYIPRLFFGFHKLRYLRQLEREHPFHHFYNPDPYPFPVLKYLKRPVIYTITSGVGNKTPNLEYFSRFAAVVVPDERSLAHLKRLGLTNVHCIRPGIDTERFTTSPLPITNQVRLMYASAPWTKEQFETKGFNALLQAAAEQPSINLVLLWRGVLYEELLQRIEQYNVGTQVQVINEQADVNQVLGTVHATILLASKPGIVKSYPHSLIDSIVAGKPVIVSRAIPISDFVERTNCGVVQETVTAQNVKNAVAELLENYAELQENTGAISRKEFNQENMIGAYETIYYSILQGKD